MEQTKSNVHRPYQGLITDVSPFDQPKETYPYALNAVNETLNGDTNFLSMENAIEKCESLPEGTVPVGNCYMYDDNVCVWLKGSDGYDYIGIINKYNNYESHVKTKELNFSADSPINGTFKLRRSNNRVVYWVEDNNHPRYYNFDRPRDFYSVDYDYYLGGLAEGVADTFTGEKFSGIHFDLIKTYELTPEFSSVEIIKGGSIPSGSYSAAIQLVDANMNPTEWITTSNPVNIYVDALANDYALIRGSRNTDTNSQRYPNSSKSIKWTFENLDPNFSYYRVAVLVANQSDGNVNQALVSELRDINNPSFIYTGSINNFTETPVSDILSGNPDIASAKYIEQLENRLIIAGIKGTDINWCHFQRYASQIRSDFVKKTVELEDVSADGNPKNPITPFESVGYMWDEVYSYGIVYEMEGGLESPAFHIPGRPSGVSNGMDFYETTDDSRYLKLDSCIGDAYWGTDAWGNDLTGQAIRHHKFPKRTSPHKVSDKTTEICGIKFSNVRKPHPKVVGFKIVRNERTSDDKLVVDNALVGPLVTDNTDETNNYHAFGLMFPEVTSDKRSRKGVYIFSPEHQFNSNPLNFDEIEIQGTYDQDYKFVPTYRDETSGTGAYVQDVSPGTSYNAEYHTNEDPDGFDLQVMYRSNDPSYSIPATTLQFPPLKDTFTLAASGNRIVGSDIFFNASTDNKIVVANFNSDIDDSLFESGGKKRLLYATLKRNVLGAYSDFIVRSYYNEHNNLYSFDNENPDNPIETDEIYNGDSYTNPMTAVSTVYVDTVFADRNKKSRVWKIIIGAALIIGGIAAMVFSLGVSTTVSVAAIGYGISIAASGIQFEVMKNMIDEDYEAGLKECIEDDDNYITKNADGEVTASTFIDPGIIDPISGQPVSFPDDKFCWFSDRVDNIYFDSSVNIGLRSGLTIGLSDFINSPSPRLASYPLNSSGYPDPNLGTSTAENFEAYLINKLTILDREQSAGRLYIGIPISEFYDMNPDFLRKNREKIFEYLPLEYDCCSESREDFKNRIHYSEQSYQEEVLDNYRVFLPNNYRDIESNTGSITNIFRYNNSLFIHAEEALYHLPQNLQEKITDELVTFIGTGSFFGIPPRKISDGVTSVAGSKHHQATIVTEYGVFFVSEKEKKVYIYSDRLNDITVGNSSYFKNNLKSYLHNAIRDNVGVEYLNEYDNTYSENMIGIHSVYDERFNRIILTKIDYKPRQPFSIHTGNESPSSFVYSPEAKEFGIIGQYGEFMKVEFTNTEYFENKSFTMSYSLKINKWVSWHSYMPRMYIGTPNNLYSFVERDNSVYLHNNKEKFCKFYGKTYPFIVELNSVSNPVQTRIWNHIAVNAVVNRYHAEFNQLLHDYEHFFEVMTVYNERQLSGPLNLKVKSTKENPDDWFLQQTKNENNEAIANRVEGTWFINDFRDFIINKEQPLFSKDWEDLRSNYPIDKVVNDNAINFNKDWTELESFRGKYLSVRFAYYGENTDNDIQITVNYVIDNEQPSLR